MIRTRFAPSPTGYLHVGSARTALYSWLFARHEKGVFILRIEDTDLERSTPESVQAILNGMDWLNLGYDEGPFYQTKRFDRYREVVELLLKEGKAYRCYCSKERLDALRDEQMAKKEKPRYDGLCRNRIDKPAEPYVVRFKNPTDGVVEFNDLIRGKITISNQELDDLIIARTDGTPTYNFTVVVDDWDMKITHVLRGDDHINNTPRQINILKALGAHVPLYGHMPMILGSDGKRLSKRHGAVSVLQYREDGYLPHALINYLARLGWSHGDQEIFSREELINFFDVKKINNSPAAFNTEKLLWLNHHYIKSLDPALIVPELTWHMERLGVDFSKGPALEEVIKAQAERTKTLKEMVERSRFFYEDVKMTAELKGQIPDESKPALKAFANNLETLTSWKKEDLHQLLADTAEQFNLKLGKVAQPLRLILTGGTVSPPIDITLQLLGKGKAISRLQMALG